MGEAKEAVRAGPGAVERALEVLRNRLDSRTASFLSACVRCGLCAEACHFYLADGEADSIPARKLNRLGGLFRRYHTWLGGALPWLVGARSLDEEGLEALAAAAYGRCTACGRCALNCSVGLDPSAVINFARAMLVAADMVPRGIQGNVDAALETGNSMSIASEEVIETIRWLEDDLRETLGDASASMPIDRQGARILYALNPREIKFFPLSISAAGMIFHAAGEDWTLTSTDFDITNYGFFAGDETSAGAIARMLLGRAEDLGVEELVLAECGHGFRSVRWEAPEWLGRETPFPVRSFLELMVDYLRAGRLRLDPGLNTERVTLHDPCNLVRGGGVIEEQRYLLERAVSDFVEMVPNREHNYCCGGGGGLLAASEYAARRIESGRPKAEQIARTGAKVVATPCHNCIDQLLELNLHYKLGVEIKTVGEVVADAIVWPAKP